MKFFTFFLVLIGFRTSLTQVPAQFSSILQAHLQCQSTARVPPSVLSGLQAGNFPNDPTFRRHLLCINQRIGIQDSNGNIQRGMLTQLANRMRPPNVSSARAQQIVNQCAVQRANPEDTAFEMDRCIFRAGSSMAG